MGFHCNQGDDETDAPKMTSLVSNSLLGVTFVLYFLRYHKKMLSLQRDFLKLKGILP